MSSNSFEKLGIGRPLVLTLETAGIVEPTEIQTKTIPPALEGRNIVASAETGSGKTAAFLLPMIELLKGPGRLRGLVLAPTRELALQIEENAKTFGRVAGLRTVAIVGGANISRQSNTIKSGVDILVATPGRLNDLLERRIVALREINILVLDEADRMLDMGFLPQVRRIIKHVPAKRQTMLLTATLSSAVSALAAETMRNPVRIEATRRAATVATLCQKAYAVLSHAKIPLLLALLRQHPEDSFLVFTHTKRGADKVATVLTANKYPVVTLHSDRSQSQRNSALASFRSGRARVLVATDVAARGIDVEDVAFVVNYEVPMTAEDYVHRVGRTARAGRSGHALTLVSPEEEATLAAIENLTGVLLERSKLNGFSDGRSDEQVRLAAEIGRLRSPQRSFGPNRAAR
ncbi:MAG TPA: DEAD/DEAH box helicase [Blastocatellia bacterium]|nr:DEAD/DEAH box helicase [Blastocatellia bacterium]